MPRPVIVIIVMLSLSPNVASDETSQYEVVQIGRYVLDSPEMPGFKYIYAMSRSNSVILDDENPPFDPPGPAPVDCDSTEMLSVRFLVRRHKKHQFRRDSIYVDFTWSHSEIELDRDDSVNDGRVKFGRGQTTIFLSPKFLLVDKYRTDGVLSLEASIGPDAAKRIEFELTGCSETSSTSPPSGDSNPP